RRAGAKGARLVGADFSHNMLVLAVPKSAGKNVVLLEADALNLPLPDTTVDLVVSAFGFRNLADYGAGLRAIYRLLKPGGEFGILDFSEPRGFLGKVYGFYFRKVLPKIGTLISGVSGPYAYLPASVQKFPAPPEMVGQMQRAGFSEVTWAPYTFGIAGLF